MKQLGRTAEMYLHCRCVITFQGSIRPGAQKAFLSYKAEEKGFKFLEGWFIHILKNKGSEPLLLGISKEDWFALGSRSPLGRGKERLSFSNITTQFNFLWAPHLQETPLCVRWHLIIRVNPRLDLGQRAVHVVIIMCKK